MNVATKLMIAAFSISCFSGCTEEPNNRDLERDYFAVTLNLKFNDKLFRASAPGQTHFFPFDEGHLVVLAITAPVPAEWAFSRAKVQTQSIGQARATSGPYFLHPDITVTTMRKVELPAYICAALQGLPKHRLVSSSIRPTAVTTCQPVPPAFETDVDEATRILPTDHFYDDPVDLEFSTLVSPQVASTGAAIGVTNWFLTVNKDEFPVDEPPEF